MMECWLPESKPNSESDPPTKVRLRYKRLFLLEKESPEKNDALKTVEVNFDEFRLEPQPAETTRSRTRGSSKLIKK